MEDVRKDGYYVCTSVDKDKQLELENLLSLKGKMYRMLRDKENPARFKLHLVEGVEVLIDSYKPL